MDMWSVGCIFGELLQRMERAGASFTPKLTIMPVFQFSNWSPPTPVAGSTYQDGVLAGKVRPALAILSGAALVQQIYFANCDCMAVQQAVLSGTCR